MGGCHYRPDSAFAAEESLRCKDCACGSSGIFQLKSTEMRAINTHCPQLKERSGGAVEHLLQSELVHIANEEPGRPSFKQADFESAHRGVIKCKLGLLKQPPTLMVRKLVLAHDQHASHCTVTLATTAAEELHAIWVPKKQDKP